MVADRLGGVDQGQDRRPSTDQGARRHQDLVPAHPAWLGQLGHADPHYPFRTDLAGFAGFLVVGMLLVISPAENRDGQALASLHR
jgi:hypothetical protein